MAKKPGYENNQMAKMLPASNIYRVGDYVFVETQPSHPYQIRRIEELTKTPNGQVEAKVSCFYRRRDLSNALVTQADKHAVSAEEEGEINIGAAELSEDQSHQLKHREVFLSRQLEIINANTIRGKCSVTLYAEVEVLLDYIQKDEWFYYLLVYDPQQKTLLADRGEIGVGDEYQCEYMPDLLKDPAEDTAKCEDYETLVWDPECPLSEKQVDQFLIMARSIGTFARALDSGSSVKEPSLHLSAAAASRDITLCHAMSALHKHNYNVGDAAMALIPDGGPILCRDEMEEWSSGEATLFEEGVRKHGKEFLEIQQEYLPWKTISQLIEYYYMWKTTDKYVQQKRQKAAEANSKVTQIFIPSSNTAINLPLATESRYQVTPTGSLVTPNYCCESCFTKESTLWYPYTNSQNQSNTGKQYLCKDCWVYWKKCGGLKKPTKSDQAAAANGGRLRPRHLSRHLAKANGMKDNKMGNVKTTFIMQSTPLMKATRHLCKEKLRLKHFTRHPTTEIDGQALKTYAAGVVTPERAQVILGKTFAYKPPPLEEIVETVKKLPPKVNKRNTFTPNSDGSNDGYTTGPRMSNFSASINHKAKTLKSPTAISQQPQQQPQHAGQKRQADYDDMPPSKRIQQRLNPQQQMPQQQLGKKAMQPHMQMHHPYNSSHGSGPQIHPPDQKPPSHQQPAHHHSQQPMQQQRYPHDQHSSPHPPHGGQQYPPQHAPPGYHQKEGGERVTNGNGPAPGHNMQHKGRIGMGGSGGSSSNRKQSYKGIVQQSRMRGDPDMQYVDPPQEFLFCATKESKKSRRSLNSRVQRKIARKPFVQIKCKPELRDAIVCAKGGWGPQPTAGGADINRRLSPTEQPPNHHPLKQQARMNGVSPVPRPPSAEDRSMNGNGQKHSMPEMHQRRPDQSFPM